MWFIFVLQRTVGLVKRQLQQKREYIILSNFFCIDMNCLKGNYQLKKNQKNLHF